MVKMVGLVTVLAILSFLKLTNFSISLAKVTLLVSVLENYSQDTHLNCIFEMLNI